MLNITLQMINRNMGTILWFGIYRCPTEKDDILKIGGHVNLKTEVAASVPCDWPAMTNRRRTLLRVHYTEPSHIAR